MAHRAPHITLNQIDNPGCCGRKAQNMQIVVNKDSGNSCARQEIVHIVVDTG